MVASVLVYSMGEVIGDGLIKLPFVAGLRAAFPDARIAWCPAKTDQGTVYAKGLKPLVAGLIDEIVADGPTGVGAWDVLTAWKPFGGRTFDLVIDTQENPRRSLVARRAARRFVSPAANFALSHARPTEPWPAAVVDRLEVLLRLASDGRQGLAPLTIADPAAVASAETLLPDGPAYVGFAPGAGGAEKRWPLERYVALARYAEASGLTPVFFLGPQELDDLAAVRAALPNALLPEFDRTDGRLEVKGPLLVVALAARLTAAVANDAGPGHMFAAGGAPLLSLQKDRRKAEKFRPAAKRLELLVAEDYGADGMAALPLDAAAAALDRLTKGHAR